ncbi:MAG: hypothetical protein RIF32_01230 [Leptospirales bacterium]|jgi:hypothetical protein
MQFQPFEDGIEVNGQTVYAIVDGLGAFQSLAKRHLLAQGIGEESDDQLVIKASAWYPQAAWLKAFESIATAIGDGTLFKIGEAIPRNAQFPPSVTDIRSAVASVDVAYHLNHRKDGKVLFDEATGQMSEGIGHYGYEAAEGRNEILSTCTNPYPCAFDRGILTSMARRFERGAKIVHAEGGICRNNGGASCTYIISW